MWKKIKKTLFEWIQMIVLSVVAAVLINLFVFQPVRIEGESMIPTLQNEDYVILSKLGRTFDLDLKYG
ncbi:MAG: S26 family signal peptidase, partial [Clostridiales bacterium]|nr:S26 family signal peptidase [Clostridiales bacterium]